MRHYHGRMRDGVPVVWMSDGRRLRRLTPVDRPATPEQIAVEVLSGVVGRRAAWPLADDFTAALASWGESWDATEAEIREWAAGRLGA
jgi:hypothetical protein